MTAKNREEIELELATQFVLQNARGREFIWWLLAQCDVYGAPDTVNGQTGIHMGRRIIGTTIINHISSIDPTVYPQMMLEAHDRALSRTRQEINEEFADE